MQLAGQLKEAGYAGLADGVVIRLDSSCAVHTGGKSFADRITAKVAFWKGDFWNYARLHFGVVSGGTHSGVVLGDVPGMDLGLCSYFKNLSIPPRHFKGPAASVKRDKGYVEQLLNLKKRPDEIGRHLVGAPDFGRAYIATSGDRVPTAPSMGLDLAVLEAAADPSLLGAGPEEFPVVGECKFEKAWVTDAGTVVEVVEADGRRQLTYPTGSVPMYDPGHVIDAPGPLCSFGPIGEYADMDEYARALSDSEWSAGRGQELLGTARRVRSLSDAFWWRYRGGDFRLFRAAWHPGDITADNLVFDIAGVSRLQVFPNPGGPQFRGRSKDGLVKFFLCSEKKENELIEAVRALRRDEHERCEREEIEQKEQREQEGVEGRERLLEGQPEGQEQMRTQEWKERLEREREESGLELAPQEEWEGENAK